MDLPQTQGPIKDHPHLHKVITSKLTFLHVRTSTDTRQGHLQTFSILKDCVLSLDKDHGHLQGMLLHFNTF